MRAYSLDLRQRVVDAVQAGGTIHGVAGRFGVSVSFVKSMKQRIRDGTGLASKPRGRRPRKLAEHSDLLKSIVSAEPDLTLSMIMERLPVKVASSTLWEALERLDLTLKKVDARIRTRSSGR